MLKRKSSYDHNSSSRSGGPHVSIFSDDPTPGRHKRKRALFRPKQTKPKPQWIPTPERSMSELLEFVLQHEDAFKKLVPALSK